MKRFVSLVFLLGSSIVACAADVEPSSTPQSSDPSQPPEEAEATPKGTIRVEVDGKGRVRSEPAGIDCPGSCEASFPIGTRVSLAPAAAEGWRLDRWAGECTGKGECAIDVEESTFDVRASLVLIDARWDPSFGAEDCAAAWGTNGEKLSPCDTTPDNYVVVRKSARNVALCDHGSLVQNYRAGLGFAPTGTKEQEGDGKTPEGVFYIPRLVPNSSYYKAFLLSYPTKADAARGEADGLINASVRAQIEAAHDACTEPPQTTALGGLIEIHGKGSSSDWTLGCVALDNQAIDVLWSILDVGDSIVVLP